MWRTISAADRTALKLASEGDGEFWMSVEDFLKHFTELEVCSVAVDMLYEDENGGRLCVCVCVFVVHLYMYSLQQLITIKKAQREPTAIVHFQM